MYSFTKVFHSHVLMVEEAIHGPKKQSQRGNFKSSYTNGESFKTEMKQCCLQSVLSALL